jgi:predicted methyltransferase
MKYGPLLTRQAHDALQGALRANRPTAECSLDLERSTEAVAVAPDGWTWQGQRYPYLQACKDRTIYFWDGAAFQPAARFTTALTKLVPTKWGPPTFEIDGIKMLPTEHVSPYADAERKVGLVRPRGKAILDTCGGLGYTAAACLKGGAQQILSFEKSADVLWLRSLNPWSPDESAALTLTHADITERITLIADASIDAILHDPPRFGIAGELYSQTFYDQLARVLKRKGRLFHYTGSPNKPTTGRDVPKEVAQRLRNAGFDTDLQGDGVLATKT